MVDHIRALTCGTPLGSIEHDDVTITEVAYRAGDTYAAHAHDAGYLILMCAGGFTEDAHHGTVEVTSGDVLSVPAGVAHRDVIARAGAHGLLVTFRTTPRPAASRWQIHRGNGVVKAMVALRRDLALGAERLAIDENLLDLEHGDAPMPPETRAVRIARELLEGCSERDFGIADIARHAGVTAPYLARAFRRSTGRTMSAHLRIVRARRAAAMLTGTEHPIVEIALSSGFADQSHLSRVFKSIYGMSPRRYRQLMSRSNPFKN